MTEGLIKEALLIANRAQIRDSLHSWNIGRDSEAIYTIRKTLIDAGAINADIYNISIFDDDGDYVASIVDESVYKIVNNGLTGDPSIYIHMEGDIPCAAIAMKVSQNGVSLGYIEVDYYLSALLYELKDGAGLGDTGEWLFAVRNNNGDALFVMPLKYDDKAAFSRTISKDAYNVPIAQAMIGNEIIMRNAADYLGQSVLASTRYISALDWGVVAKINEDEVKSTIDARNRKIYIFELFLIVFSVLVGFIVSVYISKPLEKLKTYTAALREGIDERGLSKGWTEIRQLAGDFGEMSRFVRDMKNDFNNKVAERTKELDEANTALKEMACRDPLTGLYNLRYFKEKLNYEHTRACRYKSNFTLVAFDIDHFKKINDTWGHPAGDEVLVCMSSFLSGSLRSTDVVARVGGEEFAILFPEELDQGVRNFIERLRQDISLLEFDFDGHKHHITCSFGVAAFGGDDRAPADIVKKADNALYRAKELGRNRVVYESSLNTVVDIGKDRSKKEI